MQKKLAGRAIVFGITLQSQAKKNRAKINDLKEMFNKLIEKEADALESLKELKANYTQSVWKSAEDAFNLVDHEKLEQDLLTAERICNKGVISVHAASLSYWECGGSRIPHPLRWEIGMFTQPMGSIRSSPGESFPCSG